MARPGDKPTGWQFWIDRGGTFTDVVGRRPDGELVAVKRLSKGGAEDAGVSGIRDILAQHHGLPSAVDAVRIATTVATNALLERQAPALALVVTAGFEDQLSIGDQRRPDLFARHIVRPSPPVEHIVPCAARMLADGTVRQAVDDTAMEDALRSLRDRGVNTLAISLVHGWRYTTHEQQVADIARRLSFDQIVCSFETAPVQGYLARTETTLADAWLTPIVRNYLNQFRRALAGVCDCTDIYFMQSHGGLIDAGRVRGKDAVLSGPAGGIVGVARTAETGERVIGFDMGGTSTDVCVWLGEFERRLDNHIGGHRLATPMLRLETIAAGGGSRLDVRDGRLCAGPASAGAQPGPAAYGMGGPATVTDANVVLGRLPVEHVPATFGADGRQALSRGASETALVALQAALPASDRAQRSVVQLAEDFVTVAVDNMASAVRRAVLERGERIEDFSLCAFGGAAGQLVCRVADELGIDRITLHPLAGVFSALGIGLAERMSIRDVPIGLPLDDAGSVMASTLAAARRESVAGEIRASVVLQVPGTDTPIVMPYDEVDTLRRAFDVRFEHRFGLLPTAAPDVVALRLETVHEPANALPAAADAASTSNGARREVVLFADGAQHSALVIDEQQVGDSPIAGPLIVIDANTTLVIDPGWQLHRDTRGRLCVDRHEPRQRDHDAGHAAKLEVFHNRFRLIAEQMGYVLERTAHSVNIRERLDFSCALFDSEGRLIANAPHMPVHLGSMGASVQHVINQFGDDLGDGDVVALNSPFAGGTHLPDITLVQPWSGTDGRTLCYLATRAHHADVGGISPGSMPADSRQIHEEGVVLDGVFVVRDGRFEEAVVRDALTDHPHPVRNVERNLADIRAQIASLAEGRRQIAATCAQFGEAEVVHYMAAIRHNAALAVRQSLRQRVDGSAEVQMDNGLTVAVDISLDGDTPRFDFSRSSAQHAGNFNAPLAVTRAALLYVLRTLVDHDIPLNDGCLADVDLIVPAGCFLNPRAPAAVVAGNVETSQCVTNALYAALGVMAHAQGTMNNLTFGNDEVQYYETIAGGTGAGSDFDGAHAVQSHMTNSRMTDVEVLETRLPVTVDRFSIRRGSGGAGKHAGGDGVIRALHFAAPVEVTILGGFRDQAPLGLAGGSNGKPGRNVVEYSNGRRAVLPAVASVTLAAGDRIIIETPGGGGCGQAPQSSSMTAASKPNA